MNNLLFFTIFLSCFFITPPSHIQGSENMPLQPLQLYVMPGCMYCQRVENFLKTNNIPSHKVTIVRSYQYDTLIKLSGGTQVPFLWNPNTQKGMLESLDIIAYLSIPAHLP